MISYLDKKMALVGEKKLAGQFLLEEVRLLR